MGDEEVRGQAHHNQGGQPDCQAQEVVLAVLLGAQQELRRGMRERRGLLRAWCMLGADELTHRKMKEKDIRLDFIHAIRITLTCLFLSKRIPCLSTKRFGTQVDNTTELIRPASCIMVPNNTLENSHALVSVQHPVKQDTASAESCA